MASKQRMTELRITRNGTGRTRSLCGGTVIGDYVDPQTGERVLTVKVVSVAAPKAKKGATKPKNAAQRFVEGEPSEVTNG